MLNLYTLANAVSKPFQQSKFAGDTNPSLLGPCLDKLLACANCSSCNWFSMSSVMTTHADNLSVFIKISQALANPQVGRTSSRDTEECTTVIVISWHMDAKLMCKMNAKPELLIQSDLFCYTAMLQCILFVIELNCFFKNWRFLLPTFWPEPDPQVSPPMQINVRNSNILSHISSTLSTCDTTEAHPAAHWGLHVTLAALCPSAEWVSLSCSEFL